MARAPDTDRDRAEKEAAAWLVDLSGNPADRETRARFEAWRAASDLNREVWTRTRRAYDLIGKGHPRHRDDRQPPDGHQRARPALRARRRAVLGIAAAAVALLAGVAGPDILVRWQADHATTTAEMRTVALADGTTASLAPESAIAVDFQAGERRVRLLRGRAFFDVIQDVARPFRVVANTTVVTVVGTAFDVTVRDAGADIAVQKGDVLVDGPAVSERLRSGDWLRTTGRADVARGTLRPGDVASWMRGELVVRDRPIGEVIAELRRYYRGVIVLRDSAFAERRISGIYDLRDPAATLRALAAAHEGSVRTLSPWLLIISAS